MFEKKEHQNSATLGKDTINNWIITFLSVEKRFSFNKGAQPDVYFLDVTCIGILLLGFISKSLKKSLNRFIVFFVLPQYFYRLYFIIILLNINKIKTFSKTNLKVYTSQILHIFKKNVH